MWVRLVEVVVQTTVTCSACRARVRLVEDRASVQTAEADLASAISDLSNLFKGI
jgi:hypothetical protein